MCSLHLQSSLCSRLSPSSIRELEHLSATVPGLISLGPGQPDPTLFPVDEIRNALADAFSRPGMAERHLQYGPSQGEPELVAGLVQHMRHQGIDCDSSHILVTAGAQQAIDLIAQLTIDEGDTVLVQEHTYPGALQVFRARGATVVSLADSASMATASRVKFIYAMADFQNPTGRLLTQDERSALIANARRQDTWIVEDAPYREIAFEQGADMPSLLKMDCGTVSPDAGRTLFVGSFSKVMAPGLRVGWIVGPARIIALLTLLRQATDLQPSSLSQGIVADLLRQGMHGPMRRVKRRYEERRDAMLGALRTHMASHAVWNEPQGGFFIWLQLRANLPAKQLLPFAIGNGMAYVPGAAFHFDGQDSSFLRLSFSRADAQMMEEAIRRLAMTVDSFVAHPSRGTAPLSLHAANTPT